VVDRPFRSIRRKTSIPFVPVLLERAMLFVIMRISSPIVAEPATNPEMMCWAARFITCLFLSVMMKQAGLSLPMPRSLPEEQDADIGDESDQVP